MPRPPPWAWCHLIILKEKCLGAFTLHVTQVTPRLGKWYDCFLFHLMTKGNSRISLALASWSEGILGDGQPNTDKQCTQYQPTHLGILSL